MYNYQDSYEKYQTTIIFVALVLMCAILFLNIIVAILFDNYEDSDDEDVKAEVAELMEKAQKLGKLLSSSCRHPSGAVRHHHPPRHRDRYGFSLSSVLSSRC